MSKMPETSKFAGKRMSPALAAYLKRTMEQKPQGKLMSIIRPK